MVDVVLCESVLFIKEIIGHVPGVTCSPIRNRSLNDDITRWGVVLRLR